MPPFVVLARSSQASPWAVISKPLATVAEATPVVQQALATQAGGRVAVVEVLRTFRASLSVDQDAQPDLS